MIPAVLEFTPLFGLDDQLLGASCRLTIHDYYASVCEDAALRACGIDEYSLGLTKVYDPVEREWTIEWFQPKPIQTDYIPW